MTQAVTAFDLFQAKPETHFEPPDNFSPRDVSLQEIQELEASVVQKPGARWTTTQRFFFEALLSSPTLDTKWAAKKVGVKPAQVKRWLANPATQQLLNAMATRRMRSMGLDPDKMLRKAARLLDMAMGDLPVKKTFQSKDAVWTEEVYQTDLSAATRVMDLLAKIWGLYSQEDNIGGGVTLNLNMGSAASPPGQAPALEHQPDAPTISLQGVPTADD